MKKSLLGLMVTALFIATAHGQTNVVDLGTGDILAVSTAGDLTVRGTPASLARPATVVLKDQQGVCEMRLMFGIPQRVPSKDELKRQLNASAQPLLADSVEGKVEIKELSSAAFTLIYFELTDKNEDPGDGRYMVQGCGTSGRYICQFMMLTHEKTSDAKTAMMKALASMDIRSAN